MEDSVIALIAASVFVIVSIVLIIIDRLRGRIKANQESIKEREREHQKTEEELEQEREEERKRTEELKIEAEIKNLLDELGIPAFSINTPKIKEEIVKKNIKVTDSLLPEILKKIASEYHRIYTLEDELSVKEYFFDKYNIIMDIIDSEVDYLLPSFTTTTDTLTKKVRSMEDKGRQKNYIQKWITEQLNNTKQFYSAKLEIAKTILKSGIYDLKPIDFNKQLKRNDNLKYFPEFENKKIEFLNLQREYRFRNKKGVELYNIQILKNSIYPGFNKKEFELDYNNANYMLIINYQLPHISQLPRVKELNYLSAKSAFREVFLSQREEALLYEEVLYQIVLRTNYEIFKSDTTDSIRHIVFNGWVKPVEESSKIGKKVCILSMQASKEDFLSVSLETISPKACFQKFKGVASDDLSELKEITPILNFDRKYIDFDEDKKQINDSNNLLLMSWPNFEALIKDVYGKEFAENGCEIKDTKANQAGGLDLRIFDPDPITGGNIIIQIRRNINVVNLASVRDLYATVTTEGVTKGIMVTTSDYGVDSYEFVKGKPIVLLDGEYLIALFKKYGYTVTIDIHEAKIKADN